MGEKRHTGIRTDAKALMMTDQEWKSYCYMPRGQNILQGEGY